MLANVNYNGLSASTYYTFFEMNLHYILSLEAIRGGWKVVEGSNGKLDPYTTERNYKNNSKIIIIRASMLILNYKHLIVAL